MLNKNKAWQIFAVLNFNSSFYIRKVIDQEYNGIKRGQLQKSG